MMGPGFCCLLFVALCFMLGAWCSVLGARFSFYDTLG